MTSSDEARAALAAIIAHEYDIADPKDEGYRPDSAALASVILTTFAAAPLLTPAAHTAPPAVVSAEAERLQAELDRIANIPIIAYTLDLEAQIERRRLDLGAIQDLTRADRPYDWRLEQIQQIAREGLSR